MPPIQKRHVPHASPGLTATRSGRQARFRVHARAERIDLASHFVPEHERLAHREIAALAFEVVREIGAANAAGAHAHSYLAWAGFGRIDFVDANQFGFVKDGCQHGGLR